MNKLSGVVMSLVLAMAAIGLGGCAADANDDASSGEETASDDSALAAPAASLELTTPVMSQGQYFVLKVNSAGKVLSTTVTSRPSGLGFDARTGIQTVAVSSDRKTVLGLKGGDSAKEGGQGQDLRLFFGLIHIHIHINIRVNVTVIQNP